MKYYKSLCDDGNSIYVPNFKYHLPNEKHPGNWMPKVRWLAQCVSGYHVCMKKDLIYWLGAAIYEVEGRGAFEYYDNKGAFSQIRLVKKLNWDLKGC
jgi:hypothetical protein